MGHSEVTDQPCSFPSALTQALSITTLGQDPQTHLHLFPSLQPFPGLSQEDTLLGVPGPASGSSLSFCPSSLQSWGLWAHLPFPRRQIQSNGSLSLLCKLLPLLILKSKRHNSILHCSKCRNPVKKCFKITCPYTHEKLYLGDWIAQNFRIWDFYLLGF